MDLFKTFKLKLINLAVVSFLIFGCSSAGSLSVKSNPSQAVVKLSGDDGEIRELGKTPLALNFSEVFVNSKNVKLIIEKRNFETEKIIISKPPIKTNYNISVSLIRDSTTDSQIENQKRLEKVATKVAEALMKIQKKKLREAESLLMRLVDEFPNISVVFDLLGNVYYMMGDKVAAKAQYLKADSINPNNFERKKVIQRLNSGR
jgi:TolA-binding protein